MRASVERRGGLRACATWLAASAIVGAVLLAAPSARGDVWIDTGEADFLAGARAGVAVTPTGDVRLGPGPPVVTKRGLVLDTSPSGPDSVRAYYPFVLREANGTYTMWYVGFDGTRFRMMVARSPDGVAWAKGPVVIDVRTPPWNFDSVASMSVLKEGSTYHMWFAGGFWSGGPQGYWIQIYHATSTDGLAWTIEGPALGLGAPGSWDDALIHFPWVVALPGGYRMYYAGWNGQATRIGLATSTTYTGFARFSGNPILDLGGPGTWDAVHVHAPSVLPGPPWRMFYGASDGPTWLVGAAVSDDGLAWSKVVGNPVLLPDPAPSWDRADVAAAAVLEDPAGTRLYYSGGDEARLRVGLADARDGFLPVGTLTSRVFDAGANDTDWTSIAWDATVPAGASVALTVRSGNTSAPDATWSPWSPAAGDPAGSALSLPTARFAQYRAALSTANRTTSPALHEVRITYTAVEGPEVPRGFPWAWLLATILAVAVAFALLALLLRRRRRDREEPPSVPPPPPPPPS